MNKWVLVSIIVITVFGGTMLVFLQTNVSEKQCWKGSTPTRTCNDLVEPSKNTHQTRGSEPDVKRVMISGKDAQDMCAAMRIPCPSNPTFSAAYYGQFVSTVFTVNQDIYEVRLNKTSVCVIPQTVNSTPTCHPREDDNKYFVEILNLRQNYTTNEPISFVVHEKGFDVRCFSVYAKILDSFGNKIWEQSQVMECAPGLGKSDFDNNVPFETRITKPGIYDLFTESRSWELKRQFSVSDAEKSKQSLAAQTFDNLKNGPSPVTDEQANFIKSIALLDHTVGEFVKGKTMDFNCCTFMVNGSDPANPRLEMSFFDKESKKQLDATFDLNQVKVIKTEIHDSFNTGRPIHKKEITILSISPQNVTLPEHKNPTSKTTCSHGSCFMPE